MESSALREPTADDFTDPFVPRGNTQRVSDLNAVRDRIVTDQATHEGAAPGRAPSLYVDPNGTILLREQVAVYSPRALSAVTSEVFYAPDLNRIAATIRSNQEQDNTDPSRRDQQLFVDKNGDILFGDQVDPRMAARVSRVTQETFYGRRDNERAIAAAKLPNNAFEASDGDVEGWVYNITNEFHDTYQLFIWYDRSDRTYKVSLVDPRLGGSVDVEDCHLYPDGTLCLKRGGGPGYSDMEAAYARSVLWTRGASCYRRGYGFQFNMGQA